MEATVPFVSTAVTAATPERLAVLDSWLDRTPAELERVYQEARVPRLTDVRGDLRGRMLAWKLFDERPVLASVVRRLGGWNAFPWRGKSFSPHDELRGEGINRVFADRFRLFRFDTFIGRSRAGDFDAVQLDYDLDGNPPGIRSIKDEIREVAPGLWLGQAWAQLPKKDVLVLYFGLARVA